jgi:hypothetical protein
VARGVVVGVSGAPPDAAGRPGSNIYTGCLPTWRLQPFDRAYYLRAGERDRLKTRA